MHKRLVIVDGNALIHRAYHALPKLTTKKGQVVNAVYGSLLAFFKVIKDFNPDFICACFDVPAPTFRHKEFKQYKAHRVKTPEDLVGQISKTKKVLQVFSVPIFEQEGYEADDLIGTIANKSQNSNVKIQNHISNLKSDETKNLEIIILTGDLDLLQLVNKNTKACIFKKGIKHTVLYDENKVQERYGLSPALLSDYKALVGDASDNIPGVPGVGPKTATMLLKEFGTLENLYEKLKIENSLEIENCKLKISPRVKKFLREGRKQAFLSKMLAEIRCDVPINFDLQKCEWKDYNKEKAVKMLEQWEFHSLIKRLPQTENKSQNSLFK